MAAVFGGPTKRPTKPAGAPEASTRKHELLISCEYSNELPTPSVPKLLRAMPSVESLCRYRPTALELDHRPLLLSERELLSRIEFVNREAYGEDPAKGGMLPPPPPADAQLLRDDDLGPEVLEAEAKRARLTERTEASHRQAFGLQLPQLVTNDVFTERQRYTTGRASAEKKLYREAPGFATAEELAEKIERTFEAAKGVPVHPSKPSMKPKRILSIVPDAVLWANRYRQVAFDELPCEPQRNDLLYMSAPTARITCFGYFAPDLAGGSSAYKLKENYIWDNKGSFTKQADCGEGEAVLLSFPNGEEPAGEARFVLVPTVMRLKKQRATRLDLGLDTQGLSVSTREPEPAEQEEITKRMSVVMTDKYIPDRSEASFDFVGGEWHIKVADSTTNSSRGRHSPASGGVSAANSQAPASPRSAAPSPAASPLH